MEMRGIEPRTFHMLSERYTTKPHPQFDDELQHLCHYKQIPIAIRILIQDPSQ